MKTKYWLLAFGVVILVCLALSLALLRPQEAAFAEIRSGGVVLRTLDLSIDQEFSVDGHNTVTVRDGKIAVTWADCPDGYCMERGFCGGGADIVCLPNRLVIHFTAEQDIDGVVG